MLFTCYGVHVCMCVCVQARLRVCMIYRAYSMSGTSGECGIAFMFACVYVCICVCVYVWCIRRIKGIGCVVNVLLCVYGIVHVCVRVCVMCRAYWRCGMRCYCFLACMCVCVCMCACVYACMCGVFGVLKVWSWLLRCYRVHACMRV